MRVHKFLWLTMPHLAMIVPSIANANDSLTLVLVVDQVQGKGDVKYEWE